MTSIRSVLITGANRGIGLEFVKQLITFQPKIQNIIATCRQPSQAPELTKLAASTDNVKILAIDLLNYDKYDELYSQVESIVGPSGLDLLINNAGILIRSGLDDVTSKDMMHNFEVNAVVPLMFTKKLLLLIKASQSTNKKIINITSKMGSISDNGSGGHYAYRASKAALNMITKSLSVDLSNDGIICIAIHPGWVQTDMGGPSALITTEQSVSDMIKTIFNSDKSSSGKMFNYDGKIIDW